MAGNKPKTPPPPRGPQGPRQRKDTRKGGPDRQRTTLYAVAGAGVVALIAVIAFIAFGNKDSGPNDAKVASAMVAAGCTFKTVNGYVPGGQTHVDSLTKKFPWNTTPPSNGQHYPLRAVWGFYTSAVNPRQVVHNEEHGGVVLWWGSKVPAATVSKLQALYNEQPVGVFGTPFPELGSKVAITAWTGNPATYQRNGDYGKGHIAVCPKYTTEVEKAFVKFRDTFRGHGPEGIPLSEDEPGDGPS
jgi:Protein of unknown function (DUF3105)